MSEKDDLIIIGGVAVLLWWLVNNWPQLTGTSSTAAATPVSAAVPSCTTCGNSNATPTTVAPKNTLTPNLGNWQNDATLKAINDQIDAANAQGNWALSWQLAAQRDAAIKLLGY